MPAEIVNAGEGMRCTSGECFDALGEDRLKLRREIATGRFTRPHRVFEPQPGRVADGVPEAEQRSDIHWASPGEEGVSDRAIAIRVLHRLEETERDHRVGDNSGRTRWHAGTLSQLFERRGPCSQGREEADLVRDEEVL